MKNILIYLVILFNIHALKHLNIRNLIRTSIVSLPFLINPVLAQNTKDLFTNNFVNYTASSEESNPFSMPDTAMIRVKENNIYFYGPITHSSSRELKHILIDVDEYITNKDKNDNSESKELALTDKFKIHLHIQSMGGSLMDTWYLVDLIKSLDHPVYTYIDGYAASAATLISVVGEKRFISPNSFMLIHQLSSGSSGTYSEMDDSMQNNKNFMETINNIYLKKTLFTKNELNNILKRDLWLDAQSCKKYGLIDEIE
jgi:ATP-dependent protease ClpP protease subunit